MAAALPAPEGAEMKARIPRWHPDQKQYLSSIERDVLQLAEKAGEKYVLFPFETLKWLHKVAQRAPYPRGGRPRKVALWLRDIHISQARTNIAEIKAKHKQAGKAPDGKR